MSVSLVKIDRVPFGMMLTTVPACDLPVGALFGITDTFPTAYRMTDDYGIPGNPLVGQHVTDDDVSVWLSPRTFVTSVVPVAATGCECADGYYGGPCICGGTPVGIVD